MEKTLLNADDKLDTTDLSSGSELIIGRLHFIDDYLITAPSLAIIPMMGFLGGTLKMKKY